MSKLGLIGSLVSFDPEKDDFNFYIEQLEQYFVANDVKDGKKVAVLISVIGTTTYKLLRNLLMPKLPSDCSYPELTKTLKDHLKPVPIIIAERFRFHKRDQKSGETISQYMVELRRLASTCEFGTFLDEALRDRFVCGLSCEATQRCLLAKKKLQLSEALDIAKAMELADSDTATMKTFTPVVNKVQKGLLPEKKKFSPANVPSGNSRREKSAKCYRCGAMHDPNKCKYKSAKCHFCSKIGHISPMCRAKLSTRKVEAKESTTEVNLFSVQLINQVQERKKYLVPVKVNGKSIDMELDTAADVSIISEKWLKKNLPQVNLEHTSVSLRDYNHREIEVSGEVNVEVSYHDQLFTLPLVIVKHNRPALFGKNWLAKFKLDWNQIFSVSDSGESIESLKKSFGDLFKERTSPIKHFKATLKMNSDSSPIFCKARPVPYSLKTAVCEEIKETEERGVWTFVEHSKWATPVVVVPKKNNSVRLCGDFKVTVNKHLDPNQYPLPTQQDLFATLRGGKYFTKLDLSHAYQQIELDSKSQELLTLNTLMGLVRPTRLLYGITSAASIFQCIMEQIIQGIPNVICFQDDVLVSSSTKTEHISNLRRVLDRFRKYNVQLNAEKCKFLETSIEFLGHIIDENGIHPTSEKIEAIKNIKIPENVTKLKSFLGILNYYSKFIKNSSTLLAPLHNLLNKDVPWLWSKECDEVFTRCKQLLTSDAVLVHYDERLPLQLSCDASPVGLGAVLSHIIDGKEHPVAYASRTLTNAESNYSQTEKEALSIIFGCKKFHQYLFGREFILYTDHQPLVTIFAPDKAIPAMAAARLQRWALHLSSFKYTIKYKKGDLHKNADSLSRLPIEDLDKSLYPSDIFKISYVENLPVTAEDIARATRTDKILGVVFKYVQFGFPISNQDPLLTPFFKRKDELSCDNNCLLWGMRVVIPETYRNRMLDLLHDTHPGVTKMKAVARSHFWWPNLDLDIENVSSQCDACQVVANCPPVTPLQSWVWPRAPWDRIHLDFAQKEQVDYLIIVDSFSKWLEVVRMPSTTSSNTIASLHQLFSRYGLPLEVVSDNGPQFISCEFSTFLKSLGVLHTLVPTYHPQSNGLAERSVQTFKHAISKMLHDSDDRSTVVNKINRFLLNYRSSPHSPAELFLGRSLRTMLDLVHPCTSRHVEKKQNIQKKNFDRSHTRNRSFNPGQDVWVRSHRDTQNKWVPGRLIEPRGSKSWVVDIDMKKYLAHLDQLRTRTSSSNQNTMSEVVSSYESSLSDSPCQETQERVQECVFGLVTPSQSNAEDQVSVTQSQSVTEDQVSSTAQNTTPERAANTEEHQSEVRRYPQRIRKKPSRLKC